MRYCGSPIPMGFGEAVLLIGEEATGQKTGAYRGCLLAAGLRREWHHMKGEKHNE